MISLVKNELIKIFHKKGLYIYGIIIIIFMTFTIVIDKVFTSNSSFDYYKIREENLEKYEINNREDLDWYVSEKTQIDTHKISKEYDFYSPEFYYVDNDISSTLYKMNTAKYIEKDDELYKMFQDEYDEQLKKLENFNWRLEVQNEQKELEQELEKYKNMEETSEIKSHMEWLECKLTGMKYRLKNDVAPSYGPSSLLVDNFVDNNIVYNSMNKDEETYTSRDKLLDKRRTERDYYITKYKIENDIVESNEETFQDAYINDISSAGVFFIIAMLIIAGGIFAEEFNKGTIKQLLVRPFTRTQIYLSKIIAIFIAVFMFILAYCGITFIYYAIENGNVGSIFEPIIDYSFKTNSVVEYSSIVYLLRNFMAILPQLVILTFVCTFVGIVATSTVGAVISVFGLIFVNGILSAFLPEKILSFLPMNCWDFTSYLTYGMSYNPYGNFESSLLVCIITIALLFGLGLWIFNKKDIKNQ